MNTDDMATLIGEVASTLMDPDSDPHLVGTLRKTLVLYNAQTLEDTTAAVNSLLHSCKLLALTRYEDLVGSTTDDTINEVRNERIRIQGGL